MKSEELKVKGISMKAMRYIWIVLGLLSVVTIKAATYGMPYQPQYQHRAAYFRAQSRTDMPVETMESVNSTMMYSGSALPLAAATGVSTADSPSKGNGGPRRAMMEDPTDPFGGQTIGGTTNPLEPGTPIGDGILPMMVMAVLFAGFVAMRRRRQVKMID